MFTTGFSMEPQPLAETMEGPTMEWLQQQAAELDAAIAGSFIVEALGTYFNRLVFMQPDGTFDFYDKRHLFTLAGEDTHYQAGKTRLEVVYKDWKICPLICYDLRFPVWSRNTNNYDLLLYLANWPEMRRLHWQRLLAARAIENQVYTVGLNRIGQDGNDYPYVGDTSVISFSGEVLFHVSQVEDVHTITLNKADQAAYRKKLAFLEDRDRFKIW